MEKMLSECHVCNKKLTDENQSDEALICKKCHILVLEGRQTYKCKMHNLICKIDMGKIVLVTPVKEPEYIDDCGYLRTRRYRELSRKGDKYGMAKLVADVDKSYLTMLDE